MHMRKGVSSSAVLLIVAALIVAVSVLNYNGINLSEFVSGLATKPAAKGCSDSDGGNNVYAKGTCTDKFGSFVDYCSGTRIVEYTCGKYSQCLPANSPCPAGYACAYGACGKVKK